ncbi:VWA domain-containing protein [Alloscardovia venturai]|uniref:VWA domain-containing protein n=1 Tax=Alloscardovia venturai TaxID=1769421 RepID=A0ABW2Y692_9BIFI
MSVFGFFPTRLIWPFALGVICVCALIVIAAAILVLRYISAQQRKQRRSKGIHKAGNEAVSFSLETDLRNETAQRYARTYKRFSVAAIISLVVAAIAGAVLVARPAVVNKQNAQSSSRDIMLCLDVSGSALAYDRQIIGAYSSLVNSLHGERIGLNIFNSTSKTVFPLTDDYSVVTNQLNYAYTLLSRVQSQKAIDAMSDKQYQEINDWLSGTQNIENSTSLIGDGLASCIASLPQYSSTASRKAHDATIVLATDNVPSGKQTFTLSQALDIAHTSHINVDALYVGTDQTSKSQAAQDMKTTIEKHGGSYVDLNSNDTVQDIVRDISTTKSGAEDHDDTSDLIDAPALVALIVAIAYMLFILVAGRIRR